MRESDGLCGPEALLYVQGPSRFRRELSNWWEWYKSDPVPALLGPILAISCLAAVLFFFYEFFMFAYDSLS